MSYDEKTVVARVRRLRLRELRLWVDQGLVQPARGEAGPVFDDVDVARLRLLCDLRKDMSLPNDALPVVLTLIDRLHETRRTLQTLSDAVAHQPEPTRRAIIDSFVALKERTRKQ